MSFLINCTYKLLTISRNPNTLRLHAKDRECNERLLQDITEHLLPNEIFNDSNFHSKIRCTEQLCYTLPMSICYLSSNVLKQMLKHYVFTLEIKDNISYNQSQHFL